MTALDDTLANFRSLGAAAARLVADLLDGPELCVHDLSEYPEWGRGWEYGWRAAEVAYGVGRFESSRAEGTQRAQTPGEVSGNPSTPPSPGDQADPGEATLLRLFGSSAHWLVGLAQECTDSALLARAADVADRLAALVPTVVEKNDLLTLADVLRDRSAQLAAVEAESELSIGHEDLAAHITASLNEADKATNRLFPPLDSLADHAATDLLADFNITPK